MRDGWQVRQASCHESMSEEGIEIIWNNYQAAIFDSEKYEMVYAASFKVKYSGRSTLFSTLQVVIYRWGVFGRILGSSYREEVGVILGNSCFSGTCPRELCSLAL